MPLPQLRHEGRQAGIVLGIARGMGRGMGRRTLDIARNMLQEGSELGFIGRVTGLPMESIRGLQIA